jgi:hypothetical protein
MEMPGTRNAAYFVEVSAPAAPTRAKAPSDIGTASKENQAHLRNPWVENHRAMTTLAAIRAAELTEREAI